jgi:hypothetical protein
MYERRKRLRYKYMKNIKKERKEELDTNTVEERVKKEWKRCQVITKAEGEVGNSEWWAMTTRKWEDGGRKTTGKACKSG